MKTTEKVSEQRIRQFNPNNNKIQVLQDGKEHFPLFISGVGKVDCVFNHRMNRLVIPEKIYKQWVSEGKLQWVASKYKYDVYITRLVKLYKLRAFGKYIPDIEVAILPDFENIVTGPNIFKETKHYKDLKARRRRNRIINQSFKNNLL